MTLSRPGHWIKGYGFPVVPDKTRLNIPEIAMIKKNFVKVCKSVFKTHPFFLSFS